jgi:hypothetical protein
MMRKEGDQNDQWDWNTDKIEQDRTHMVSLMTIHRLQNLYVIALPTPDGGGITGAEGADQQCEKYPEQ